MHRQYNRNSFGGNKLKSLHDCTRIAFRNAYYDKQHTGIMRSLYPGGVQTTGIASLDRYYDINNNIMGRRLFRIIFYREIEGKIILNHVNLNKK